MKLTGCSSVSSSSLKFNYGRYLDVFTETGAQRQKWLSLQLNMEKCANVEKMHRYKEGSFYKQT